MRCNVLSTLVLAAAVSLLGCQPQGNSDDPQPSNDPQASSNAEESAPVASTNESSDDQAESGEEAAKDIVDTAVAAGNFSTLAAALKAGDLIDTLKSGGPFTVFAPTDEAFAALPAGTLDNLLKPENKEQLVSILTYHVVPGKVDSNAVASLETAETVNGAEIAIKASSVGVSVNDAKVATADIACSNGIIHVIDAVLLPPSDDPTDPPHAGEPLTVDGVGSFKTLSAAI